MSDILLDNACGLPGSRSSEHAAWRNMKDRCLNARCKNYENYGGRGVKVYAPWINSYDDFIQYLGAKPTDDHSLDRIDSNGHYEPGNVRGATPEVQFANKRKREKAGVERPLANSKTLNEETVQAPQKEKSRDYKEGSFGFWYENHGYAKMDDLHKGWGTSQCAKKIGATPHHVRALLRSEDDDNHRKPSGILIRLMEILDKDLKKLRQHNGLMPAIFEGDQDLGSLQMTIDGYRKFLPEDDLL